MGAAVGRAGCYIDIKSNKIDFSYINYNMELVCFENRPSSLMMANNSHPLVVPCMNDKWVRFWSCRRAASAPIVSEQAGAALDVYFVIFCVNCFVSSKLIKSQKPACI